VQAIAAEADAIVVIGSANSSNTVALAKVAEAAGCPIVLRIDGPDELASFGELGAALGDAAVVGVTAGASAPEDLVQAVIARLAPTEGIVPVHVTEEDEYFPPPRELRELMSALDVAAPALFGGPLPDAAREGAFTDDRRVDASDVLAR
jgi:4-hydroxy-3-methylbut-2-enyl diphosphate reductase